MRCDSVPTKCPEQVGSQRQEVDEWLPGTEHRENGKWLLTVVSFWGDENALGLCT